MTVAELPPGRSPVRRATMAVARWVDAHAPTHETTPRDDRCVDWLRVLPFVLLHVACVAVVWVGWSPVAVCVAIVLYVVRMFAVITLGEGWYNNHHHYPGAARQGFRWWDADITYYALRAFSVVGIVRDMRPVPHAAPHAAPLVARRDLVAD